MTPTPNNRIHRDILANRHKSTFQQAQPEAENAIVEEDLQAVRLLTSSQTAELLNISTRKLWSLTVANQIRAIRIGRAVRYSLDDIRDFINRLRQGEVDG